MSKLIPTLNDNDMINSAWLPGSISASAKNIIKISGFTVIELCESPTGTIFNRESSYVILNDGSLMTLSDYYENYMTANSDGTYAPSTKDITLYTDAEDITILANSAIILQNISIRKLTRGSNYSTSSSKCTLNLRYIESLHELEIKNNILIVYGNTYIDVMYSYGVGGIDRFYTTQYNRVKKIVMTEISNQHIVNGTIKSVSGAIIETKSYYTNTNNWIKNNLNALKNAGYTISVK